LILMAQAPAIRVRAQDKPAPPKPKVGASAKPADSPHNLDPAKETSIRQLMDLTGAKTLGDQMMKAGMDQFRASINESQPNNPRAKQFVDAFTSGFQKHFDTESLNQKMIPIYDKYLSQEDVNGLVDYYRSPLGQRMLKALPEIARESQQAGFLLGQKAAQETLDELKTEYPDFVSDKEEGKPPATNPKN
jgi:uncharacterized protein